ncbi:hypothetical protein [Streptomyces platensis]
MTSRRTAADVASSIVGAVLGVAVGGALTLYAAGVAVDWAITRAVRTA